MERTTWRDYPLTGKPDLRIDIHDQTHYSTAGADVTSIKGADRYRS